MLFRYSAKMSHAAFRFPGISSASSLSQLSPGDTAHRLDHYENTKFWIRNATDVDLLRVPDLMSEDPMAFHRRLALVDGRLLSLDRTLPRHEITYWINTADSRRAREQRLHPYTFTRHGFTVPETIDWTEWVPCNEVPINPSFGAQLRCCP